MFSSFPEKQRKKRQLNPKGGWSRDLGLLIYDIKTLPSIVKANPTREYLFLAMSKTDIPLWECMLSEFFLDFSRDYATEPEHHLFSQQLCTKQNCWALRRWCKPLSPIDTTDPRPLKLISSNRIGCAFCGFPMLFG